MHTTRKQDPNNMAQLNALFAQGARCGYLEAKTHLYSPDDPARYETVDRTSNWSAWEACQNGAVGDLSYAEMCAWAWGYEHGFRLQKQGWALPAAIVTADMPEVFNV